MPENKKDIKLELMQIKLSIHEVEARMNRLEKNNINKEEEFDSRLQVLEAFYNNIRLITTEREEN